MHASTEHRRYRQRREKKNITLVWLGRPAAQVLDTRARELE